MKLEEIDQKIGMPNIDAEWAKFESEVIESEALSGQTRPKALAKHVGWLSRAAAVIGIVCCLSVATWATVYIVKTVKGNHTPETTTVEQPVSPTDDANPLVTNVANDSISVDDTALRFDNIELQRIVAILCEYYGIEARYENEDAKHLRLYVRIDKTKSIDEVVEFLNHFDKVSMEVHDNQLIIK